MKEYRERCRAEGFTPPPDDQRKQNERRARKRAIGEQTFDPVKKHAQNSAGAAIRHGVMDRQPCEICGAEPAEAHHDDYSQPRSVRWLCRVHHEEHHHPQG